MSESQSRYSIVERLTDRKLELISQKSNLDENIRKKEQAVSNLKKELKDWETNIKNDLEKEKLKMEREIEKSEEELIIAKEGKITKESAINKKLEAIELALERIEEISKTSPTIQ